MNLACRAQEQNGSAAKRQRKKIGDAASNLNEQESRLACVKDKHIQSNGKESDLKLEGSSPNKQMFGGKIINFELLTRY